MASRINISSAIRPRTIHPFIDRDEDGKSVTAEITPIHLDRGSSLPANSSAFGLALKMGVFTILLAACMGIPSGVWVWYAFADRFTMFDWSNRILYSTATPTRLLLLSTFSAGIAKGIIGPLMYVHAYTTASQWLLISHSAKSSSLPTPSQ